MIRTFTARASLAAALTTLLVACGDEETAAPDLCDRLTECGLVDGAQATSICEDELAADDDAVTSCVACTEGASCGDLRADVCKKPCLGVISAIGGDAPPVSQPGQTQDPGDDEPPPPPPAEIVSLCSALQSCQIVVSRNGTCESVEVFGVQAGYVTLREIYECDQCLRGNACSESACQNACANVL